MSEDELNQALLSMAPGATRYGRAQKDLRQLRRGYLLGPQAGGRPLLAKRPTVAELRPIDRTPEQLAMLDKIQAATESLTRLRENTDPYAAQTLVKDAVAKLWTARATAKAASMGAKGSIGVQLLENVDAQGKEIRALNEETSWAKATDSERTAYEGWRNTFSGLINDAGELPAENESSLYTNTAEALSGMSDPEKVRMLAQMDVALRENDTGISMSQMAMNAESMLERDPSLEKMNTPVAHLALATRGMGASSVARVSRISQLNDGMLRDMIQFEDANEKAGGGTGSLKAIRQIGAEFGVYSKEGGWKGTPADEAADQQMSVLTQMNDALDTLANSDPKFATERAEAFNSIVSAPGFKEWKEASGFLPGVEGDIDAVEQITKVMRGRVKRNLAAAKASARLGEARGQSLGKDVAGARRAKGMAPDDEALAPTPTLVQPAPAPDADTDTGAEADPSAKRINVAAPSIPEAGSALAANVGGAEPPVDYSGQFEQDTRAAQVRRDAIRRVYGQSAGQSADV